jgi:hypothetical protein
MIDFLLALCLLMAIAVVGWTAFEIERRLL